jgi:hypothetical protein
MTTRTCTTQLDRVAQAFEALAKAVDHAPYHPEVEDALIELRVELLDLGATLRR